jgi:hypothetical protein
VGYKGNWWKLDSGATSPFVRQVAYDWVNEIDARLAIERLDIPAVKPRQSAEQLHTNLEHLAAWTESTVRTSIEFGREMTEGLGPNKLAAVDLYDYAGLSMQRYVYGNFALKEQEVLILEANVPQPPCRYWSIHLADDHAFTLDFVNRQTSINGHTAYVDEEQVFRAVISVNDPGVPNWLDTAG